MSEPIAVADRLAQLGLELPDVPAPVAAYVPAVRFANTVQTSGQLPLRDGGLVATGLVGADVTPEEAQDAARQCALNAVAAAAQVAGGVEKLDRVLKVLAFVASADGFHGQPAVADGASLLLGDLFGESGRHARSAVGVAQLPRDAAVEVEVTFSVRD